MPLTYNTMPEELNQDQPVDMTPEEAKASLGLATRLSEQFLMSQVPQEAPQEAQNGTEQEMGEEDEKEPEEDKSVALEGKFDEKLEILRTEMKDTIKNEIGSIRDEIKSALENEQD